MTSVGRILSDLGVQKSKMVLLPIIIDPDTVGSPKKLESAMRRPMEVLRMKAEAIEKQDLKAEVLDQYTGINCPSHDELDKMH